MLRKLDVKKFKGDDDITKADGLLIRIADVLDEAGIFLKENRMLPPVTQEEKLRIHCSSGNRLTSFNARIEEGDYALSPDEEYNNDPKRVRQGYSTSVSGDDVVEFTIETGDHNDFIRKFTEILKFHLSEEDLMDGKEELLDKVMNTFMKPESVQPKFVADAEKNDGPG